MKAGRFGRRPLQRLGEIQCALIVQELEIAQNVLFDLFRLCFRIEFLQFGYDLGDGVFAVATRDDF